LEELEMKKLVLAATAIAALGFVSYATDNAAAQGVSVSVGTPAVRSGVVVRERHDRGLHRGWRHHARGDVVIVKKRKPARKTVIIER
jgi:hypothetical protein